jgi:hypothetical protein
MPTTLSIPTIAKALALGSIASTCGLWTLPLLAQAPAKVEAPPAHTSVIVPELLRLREAAWRAWFAGDEATLRSLLPPEFIGIDMGDGPFSDREKTLADSRAFRAGGSRLMRLEFPETRAQRLGDVVVLYGRYSVAIESEGKQRTLAGRLTELFVLREGRWWHPGWHLDLASTGGGVAEP